MLALQASPLAAQTPEPAAPADLALEAASAITEAALRERVFVLAHDSMRGRATPSPELESAARWMAEIFSSLDLRPGGDRGGFLQWYEIPAGGEQGRRRAPNVVGVLPGSDPALRDQFVVFSAHFDHVGVGAPDATGDSIYNGADDNASGTAAVLGIAEAFAALPEAPRRSVAFVLVSGEERGLWGSRHFVDEGSIRPDRMAANLNLDMVGRNWPDTIVAVGKHHTELGAVLRQVSVRHPELGLVVIDDPWPEQRLFFRSDQYSFARRGVPAVFLFSGLHEDYHRPGDRPEKIDAEKAARVARLAFLAGLEVANRDRSPRWDREARERIVLPRR